MIYSFTIIQVSAQCAGHVKRVMHVRATNVKLMPEIEKACMHDLGDKCVGQTKDGEVSETPSMNALLI